MIRYAYINNLVLNIYKTLPEIHFPLDVNCLIRYIPNCKYMSYQQFAETNDCSISNVIHLCNSKSGCTHYDVKHNRYLILCNQSTEYNNNSGRQRWTCGHEIGHILCRHHIISAYEKLSENSLLQNINSQSFEAEADYFAATLLTPFPIFTFFNIQSPSDIYNVFGLSQKASICRFDQYTKWKHDHRKTAWENDIRRIILPKL